MADETEGEHNGLMGGFFSRINHPVFGAFAFSWTIINWDAIYRLIMGREKYEETITFLLSNYFIRTNWHELLLYPLLSSLTFLILGPIFRDMYRVFVKWSDAKFSKLNPIAQYQFSYQKAELERLQDQVRSWMEAYNILKYSADPQGRIQSLVDQVSNQLKDLEKLRHENALLKADKALTETSQKSEVVKEENVELKSQLGAVDYIIFNMKEIRSKSLIPLIELMKSQGQGTWNATENRNVALELVQNLERVSAEVEALVIRSRKSRPEKNIEN